MPGGGPHAWSMAWDCPEAAAGRAHRTAPHRKRTNSFYYVIRIMRWFPSYAVGCCVTCRVVALFSCMAMLVRHNVLWPSLTKLKGNRFRVSSLLIV